MDDRKITALLWDREESAIEALARAYGNSLYRLALNILAIPSDAEECVNDTYWAIWNRIPPLRPEPLAPYIYRVCRNTALKKRRSDAARKRNTALEESLEELSHCVPGTGLEELLDARALGRAINEFLGTQSEENRVLFLRRYWFGDPVKDIARARGLTQGAVSVRLNRLRSKLKDYLHKEGFLNEP